MNGRIDGVTFEASREVRLTFSDDSQAKIIKDDKGNGIKVKIVAGDDERNEARIFGEGLTIYQQLRGTPLEEIEEDAGARLPDSVVHSALIFENALHMLREQW